MSSLQQRVLLYVHHCTLLTVVQTNSLTVTVRAVVVFCSQVNILLLAHSYYYAASYMR